MIEMEPIGRHFRRKTWSHLRVEIPAIRLPSVPHRSPRHLSNLSPSAMRTPSPTSIFILGQHKSATRRLSERIKLSWFLCIPIGWDVEHEAAPSPQIHVRGCPRSQPPRLHQSHIGRVPLHLRLRLRWRRLRPCSQYVLRTILFFSKALMLPLSAG